MIHARDQIMGLASQRMVTLNSADGAALETLVITAPILPVILSICGLSSFVYVVGILCFLYAPIRCSHTLKCSHEGVFKEIFYYLFLLNERLPNEIVFKSFVPTLVYTANS